MHARLAAAGADDFFWLGFVLGAENPRSRARDLTEAEGFIEIDGQRWNGSASNVLSAFDSLPWLARALARGGISLRARDIVLTGTLVPPKPMPLPTPSMSMGINGLATMTRG